MSHVTYCLVHLNRLPKLQKAVRHHAPHVDRTIVIDGGSQDGSIEWLNSKECKDMNVEVYVHPWVDDPPGHRNLYLKYAGTDTWVLVTDDDEYLEEPVIWTIKQIADEAEKNEVTLVCFNSHDIQTTPNGSVWENQSSYWNPMFFKMGPGVRYGGHTHVGLARLPGKVWQHPGKYFHVKTVADQWLRGARNYWTTAQEAQNIHDAQWRGFKSLRELHGYTYFYQMVDDMRAGTIPEEIVKWFIDHRDDDNAEVRAYFVSYLVFMHPELNTGISNRDFEYDPNRKPTLNITF